jgi:hypothetical protein
MTPQFGDAYNSRFGFALDADCAAEISWRWE